MCNFVKVGLCELFCRVKNILNGKSFFILIISQVIKMKIVLVERSSGTIDSKNLSGAYHMLTVLDSMLIVPFNSLNSPEM